MRPASPSKPRASTVNHTQATNPGEPEFSPNAGGASAAPMEGAAGGQGTEV
jgi:hypothetical protein